MAALMLSADTEQSRGRRRRAGTIDPLSRSTWPAGRRAAAGPRAEESSGIANHRATSSDNIYRCALVDCHAGGASESFRISPAINYFAQLTRGV